MTYSHFLNSFVRLAAATGAIFFHRRLSAVAVLALALPLLVGLVPGSASPVFAQEKGQPQSVAAVNINKADAATLASALNGVGTARAQEIVRYREAYGPFKAVDELTDVKGIGKSTLDDNRARITLE